VNYGVYFVYPSAPPRMALAAAPPLPTPLPNPVEVSTLQSLLSALMGWVREGIAMLGRACTWGLQALQGLLHSLGLPPPALMPTTVPTPAPIVLPRLQPTIPVVGATSDWAAGGRAAATVPPKAPSAASPGTAPPGGDTPPEAPATVDAPSLEQTRAWCFATNPLEAPDAELDWEEIPVAEVRRMLSVAVSTRVRAGGPSPGGEPVALGDWLGRVARVAYDKPAERLEWMAIVVPSLVRRDLADSQRSELLTAAVDWLGEVDRRDPRAVLGALKAVQSLTLVGLDPKGTLIETIGATWGEGPWPRMGTSDARTLLEASAERMTAALARRDGPGARMFARVLGALAPAVYSSAAERLTWFARAIARPVGAAALDGAPVRDTLTATVGRWFEALTQESTCGAAEVVLEWWTVPPGACTHEEPVTKWIALARPAPIRAPPHLGAAVGPRRDSLAEHPPFLVAHPAPPRSAPTAMI